MDTSRPPKRDCHVAVHDEYLWPQTFSMLKFPKSFEGVPNIDARMLYNIILHLVKIYLLCLP